MLFCVKYVFGGFLCLAACIDYHFRVVLQCSEPSLNVCGGVSKAVLGGESCGAIQEASPQLCDKFFFAVFLRTESGFFVLGLAVAP